MRMIPVKRKKKWREARQKMIDRHPPNRVAFTTNIACLIWLICLIMRMIAVKRMKKLRKARQKMDPRMRKSLHFFKKERLDNGVLS